MAEIFDALVVSDWHLGAPNCEHKAIRSFLHALYSGDIQTKELILNGDVIDSQNFRDWGRQDKEIFRTVNSHDNTTHSFKLTYVIGNHEGDYTFLRELLPSVNIVNDYVLTSGDRHILVHHGHQFDDWLKDHPKLTKIADYLYCLLQKIDGSHELAKAAKHSCKTMVRCSTKVARGSVNRARQEGYNTVIAGHTHSAGYASCKDIEYFNTGCWTEKPCSLLAIRDGKITLRLYRKKKGLSDPLAYEITMAEIKGSLLNIC